MKKLLLALALVPCSVLASPGPNEIALQQRNSTDTGWITRFLVNPTGGANGLMYMNGSTVIPGYLTLGTGLSITSGVLSADAQVNADWNSSSGASQILNKPSLAAVATSGAYSDLTGTPTIPAAQVNSDWSAVSGIAQILNKPSLATVATTGSYNDLINKPTIPSGTVTSVIAGTGLDGGTITTSGTISLPNTGTAGAYSGVTTDAQGRVTAGTTRSFSYPARSLNSCFQASSTRDVMVAYSVSIASSLTLTTGQQGTVYLRIYSDSGCTTGTQEVGRVVGGNTGTLTIGLSLTTTTSGVLTGIIPAGLYVQMVTQNNTGTPTFSYLSGQEIQM